MRQHVSDGRKGQYLSPLLLSGKSSRTQKQQQRLLQQLRQQEQAQEEHQHQQCQQLRRRRLQSYSSSSSSRHSSKHSTCCCRSWSANWPRMPHYPCQTRHSRLSTSSGQPASRPPTQRLAACWQQAPTAAAERSRPAVQWLQQSTLGSATCRWHHCLTALQRPASQRLHLRAGRRIQWWTWPAAHQAYCCRCSSCWTARLCPCPAPPAPAAACWRRRMARQPWRSGAARGGSHGVQPTRAAQRSCSVLVWLTTARAARRGEGPGCARQQCGAAGAA